MYPLKSRCPQPVAEVGSNSISGVTERTFSIDFYFTLLLRSHLQQLLGES